MVYFVGHCILLHDMWIPLTNIPVELVNLSEDQTSRKLDRRGLSMQLMWQNKRNMQPLYTTIIKTFYIKQFQRAFRDKQTKIQKKKLPRFIFAREIGIK
jgi:hypothetical protein